MKNDTDSNNEPEQDTHTPILDRNLCSIIQRLADKYPKDINTQDVYTTAMVNMKDTPDTQHPITICNAVVEEVFTIICYMLGLKYKDLDEEFRYIGNIGNDVKPVMKCYNIVPTLDAFLSNARKTMTTHNTNTHTILEGVVSNWWGDIPVDIKKALSVYLHLSPDAIASVTGKGMCEDDMWKIMQYFNTYI